METSVQKALRAHSMKLWLIVGLLVVNLFILIGTRTHADGENVERVKIDGTVEVKLVSDPNGKAMKVEITEFPTKPLSVKETK